MPPFLDQAIVKALDVNPDRRQQSVQELFEIFDDLDRTMPRKSSKAHLRAAHQRKTLMILMALLLAVAVLGGLGILLWRHLFPSEVAPQTAIESKAIRTFPSVPPLEPTPPVPAEDTGPPDGESPTMQEPRVPPTVRPESAKPTGKTGPEPATPPSGGQGIPETTQQIPMPATPTPSKGQPFGGPKAPAGKTPGKGAVVQAKPKPKPRAEAVKPVRPKPAEPSLDWSGSMSRGETRKTTP